MPLISRYDKRTMPWKRTTGVYGHLPKFWWPEGSWRPRLGYCGYLVVITKRREITFWYQGNPWRGKFPRNLIEVLASDDR